MKIIVIGPRGKMGKLITQVAASRDDMELIAGVAPKGRDYIGTDLGTVAMVGRELGVPVVDDLEKVIDACDVIIDFSTKEMGMEEKFFQVSIEDIEKDNWQEEVVDKIAKDDLYVESNF